MTKQFPRPCPVCGGYERRLMHRQSFMDGPLGEGYDVVVCKHCGAGFADGIPSQAEMDRYYAEQSKYANADSGGAESPWDVKRFERTVEQVAPHLRSQEIRILDIGCATGGLLSVFKRRGYSNVLGADPSAECAHEAARLHGVEVRVATLARLTEWRERFDLILMLGVLEHLREVQMAVRTAAGLLNSGGLLYCAVPDVEGLGDCPNAPYQQFSVEHVNFFSTGSLRRLMAVCGLNAARTWRWTVEWREGVLEAVASGLYELGPATTRLFDNRTTPALERYLALSADGDRKILFVIDSLKRSQEPILVWGAGTLARRLLATMPLGQTNILAFVDSNPHLQGLRLAGKAVIAPAQLGGREESILICAGPFENEIKRTIKDKLGLQNRIISFNDLAV